jgi:hypothetical protein
MRRRLRVIVIGSLETVLGVEFAALTVSNTRLTPSPMAQYLVVFFFIALHISNTMQPIKARKQIMAKAAILNLPF